MEISIIWDYEKVWDKEFKSFKEHLETLKDKAPDEAKIKEMEGKFLALVKSDAMVANYYKIAAGVGVSLLLGENVAFANDGLDGVGSKIRVIVNPIIDLLAGLGYPVTYGMFVTGFIMIIMGKKSKGIQIIKWAAIGYLGLQFVPFFLNLLDMIGRELRNSI